MGFKVYNGQGAFLYGVNKEKCVFLTSKSQTRIHQHLLLHTWMRIREKFRFSSCPIPFLGHESSPSRFSIVVGAVIAPPPPKKNVLLIYSAVVINGCFGGLFHHHCRHENTMTNMESHPNSSRKVLKKFLPILSSDTDKIENSS